jgi:hypothetical protein
MQVNAQEVAMGEEQEQQTHLAEFVRAHHVHFEVHPETVVRGSERVKVGFEVRL